MESIDQGATTSSHEEENIVVESGYQSLLILIPWINSLLWLILPSIHIWKVVPIILMHLSMAWMLHFGEIPWVRSFPHLGLIEPLLNKILQVKKSIDESKHLFTMHVIFKREYRD